ncbi:MAG: GAF domain-containing protein [Anaerolineae bacterium]|nr:GAF domain-containing protein [Anaerolineae bacterium]
MPQTPTRPFQNTILLSALSTVFLAACALVAYSQVQAANYLGLVAIVAFYLPLLGLAHLQVRRPENLDTALILVVGGKLALVLLLPVVMEDYELLAALMVLLALLETIIAGRFQRLTLVLVLGLLSAALLLLLDLQDLGDPAPFAADVPALYGLVLAELLLRVVGLMGYAWWVRFRETSPLRTRLDLTTQLAIAFAVTAAASILAVTGVIIPQYRDSQIERVGADFEDTAASSGERVGNALAVALNDLEQVGRVEQVIQRFLFITNNRYQGTEADIAVLLQDRSRQWRAGSGEPEFVAQYTSNPFTPELQTLRAATPAFQQVIITDARGALAGVVGTLPREFVFDDEPWWRAAWNNGEGGLYLGDLAIDSDGDASLFMAVAVVQATEAEAAPAIGVLAARYDLTDIQASIAAVQAIAGGEVTLVDRRGTAIASTNDRLLARDAWSELLASAQVNPRAETGDWFLGTGRDEEPAVLAYAPLRSGGSPAARELLQSLGWAVVLSSSQEDALAEVTRSIQTAALVGLMVLAGIVVAAVVLSRELARPIEALTTTASAMSGGDLSLTAQPGGSVELVTLADAFNTLTGRLRNIIDNLEDQVQVRTAELQARMEQLATLNIITQEVSAVIELDKTLQTVAEEMVELFDAHDCGITLVNEQRNALTIVANHFMDPTRESLVGRVLPLAGNPSSTRVVETGESVVVNQAQTSPETASVHGLMLQIRTSGLMIVPLLARGAVIGTIGIGTDNPERQFSEAEVELAETVAGQIAGAVEASRQYAEAQRARAVAEEANASKSAFLASVSHELRTPLTSVLGFAEIIEDRLSKRIIPNVNTEDRKVERAVQQVSDNIRIILTEGERLTTLINNVLDLAKIEAGRVEWKMELLHMSEIIARAINATSALFEAKNLPLIKDFPDYVPEVVGDRDRLIQVMINLLSNAVKFTKEGSVTVRLRHDAQQVTVSVIDTGIGIAPEDQVVVLRSSGRWAIRSRISPRGPAWACPSRARFWSTTAGASGWRARWAPGPPLALPCRSSRWIRAWRCSQ